jgi:predicted RNA-binding protein
MGTRFSSTALHLKSSAVPHIYKYFKFIEIGGVTTVCEFRVFLRKNGQDDVVAEDIVYAKVEAGSIVLKNVLGAPVKIDDVSILEVDVETERLVLIPKA